MLKDHFQTPWKTIDKAESPLFFILMAVLHVPDGQQ